VVRRRRQPATEATARTRAVAVLAVSAIICGLILFFSGPASEEPVAAVQPQQELAATLDGAAMQLEQAEHEIVAANYGECRQHIRAVHQQLADLLAEMRGRPTAENGD